jgi:glycosyltransferase 2 family protein
MDLTSTPVATNSRSKFLYWAFALTLAVVLLYYSLRGIDWLQVWLTLKTTRLSYLALSLIIAAGSLILRAFRWRVLLQSGGRVGVATAFWATCAGYFGNNYLPARAGELVRTMMVDAEAGLGRTFVLTTALSERIVDAITLVFVSSVVLLTLPTRPGWYGPAAKPFAIVGICGALGIAILPRLERFWKYLLERSPVPEGLRKKLLHILEQILFGLRAFHDARRLLLFMALTAVIWFLDANSFIMAGLSVGISLTLPMACLLITGLGLGSALPSTPGYVGIFQFVAVEVLTPFGFPRAAVIAYMVLVQVMQYLTTGTWGLLALWRFRKLKKLTVNS